MPTSFLKMNGTGNDFVIFDARQHPVVLTPLQITRIAARDNAVTKGCDQVIVIEPAKEGADAFMRIYNADGSESPSCGNATRCLGWLLHQESDKKEFTLETRGGRILCGTDVVKPNIGWANMGKPKFDWKDIPLANEMDTLHMDLGEGPLTDPVGVSMGNPHAVFFVERAENIDLKRFGPRLENDPLFPQRANISVAQINSPESITLRVWERGTGETLACGTGACATLVAANRRRLAKREAAITVKGGILGVHWLDNGDVLFKGQVEKEFEGELP